MRVLATARQWDPTIADAPMKTFLGLALSLFASTQATASESAIVQRSMQAMGGRELLASIHGAVFEANAQRNFLEQSIRPEGPWVIDMYRTRVTLEFASHRMRERQLRSGSFSRLGPPLDEPRPLEYVVADGIAARPDAAAGFVPYSRAAVQDADELLAFNPLQVLFTAIEASDLHALPDEMRHGVLHRVLAWRRGAAHVRLYIDAGTDLPAAVAWTTSRPDDIYWSSWGDVQTELAFENWSLRPDGLRFPTQWSYRRNGLPERIVQIYSLELNPGVDVSAWAFGADFRRQAAQAAVSIDDWPLGTPRQPIEIPAPGVVKVPGRWDVALVRQDDGVVVLEAPIGNGYSARVLDEAERRFPGVPIKAVVSTSDAWPHIGGLREYVARGIPVYVLDLNIPIINRLLAAPHALRPDALQRSPRKAELRPVSATTTIGRGANRIELIPLRTAVGERQMLAWLPDQGLMYTSDLVQPTGDGQWYAPEMLLELKQRFASGGYRPDRCFGMHYPVTPCRDLLAALQTFLGKPEPAEDRK